MARDDGQFDDFDERMRRLRSETGLDEGKASQAGNAGMGLGMQVGIELVAGLVGGALIGWGLDVWFGTWPVLAIVFFFLGAAAGMLNAYRYIQRAGMGHGQGPAK